MEEDDYDNRPEQLKSYANKLKAGEEADPVSVRTLLSWFDAQRRGSQINSWILECLADSSLESVPDFRTVWIDGEIKLQLIPVETTSSPVDNRIATSSISPEEISLPPTSTYDPTNRIGRLSTVKEVVGVAPDSPISEAITIMLRRDFSQLPVWINERSVRGIISWKSIASRVALGEDFSRARLCMEVHREVRSDASLFDVIPIIVDTGYVLIRAPDQRIIGIVTASDLSLQFRQLAEPFLLLGEIEQHVRKLMEGRIAADYLKLASDPADAGREVQKVSDLSLGELIRLLENAEVWAKLGLNLIDRKTMVEDMHRIRSIRNDVMHFDPDPLEPDSIAFLSTFSRFLQRLDEIRGQ